MALNNQKKQHKTPSQVIKQTKEFVSNSQSNRHDDNFMQPCRLFDNEKVTPPKNDKHKATECEHNDDDINITVTLPKHANMKKNGTKTAQNDTTNDNKSDRSNKIKKHWKTLQMEGDEDWVQAHIDECGLLDDYDDNTQPSRSFDNGEACKNKDKSKDNSERKRDRIFTASKGDKHWSCSGCAGTNAHSFIQCWKCRKEKSLLKS